jgi:uncharacterized BrkB/YihY/UPF0761 family membrane protein
VSDISAEHQLAVEHLDAIEQAERSLTAWRVAWGATSAIWLVMMVLWFLAPKGSTEETVYQVAAWSAIAAELFIAFWPLARAEKRVREVGCAECAFYRYDSTFPE